MVHTALLQIRADEPLRVDAAEPLPPPGRMVADAVRLPQARSVTDGGLPPEPAVSPDAYDAWFRASVQQALDDPHPPLPHRQVMDEAQAVIDSKRHARAPA